MTTSVALGLCALAALTVLFRHPLWRGLRRIGTRNRERDGSIPSAGPYRETGPRPERADSGEPAFFVEPPPANTVYRRNRLVYAAIVMGGPLALTNVLIVPFLVVDGLQQAAAIALGVAIPCATVVGARINGRRPTVPEAVAIWSVLQHLWLTWQALTLDGQAGTWALLAAYAAAHAVLTIVAARAEPIPTFTDTPAWAPRT